MNDFVRQTLFNMLFGAETAWMMNFIFKGKHTYIYVIHIVWKITIACRRKTISYTGKIATCKIYVKLISREFHTVFSKWISYEFIYMYARHSCKKNHLTWNISGLDIKFEWNFTLPLDSLLERYMHTSLSMYYVSSFWRGSLILTLSTTYLYPVLSSSSMMIALLSKVDKSDPFGQRQWLNIDPTYYFDLMFYFCLTVCLIKVEI